MSYDPGPQRGPASVNQIEAQSRRVRCALAESKRARQRAVSAFPLEVAQLAIEMQKLLDATDYVEPGESEIVVIDEMERRICERFRERFGHDMVATEQQTQQP